MIKVKIIGAGGYGGIGIIELLLGHPEAKIACLVDVESVGLSISSLRINAVQRLEIISTAC